MAVKLEETEDYVIKTHVEFVGKCKLYEPLKDTPFVDALKQYLETGRILGPLECLKKSKENAEEKPTSQRGRKKDQTMTLKEITENDIKIKAEKISETYSETSTASSASENVVVKSESEEMPAPTKLPPWKKKIKAEPEEPKRPTRTRGKKMQENAETKERDSDIQIQNTIVTPIEISDDSDTDKKTDVTSDTDSERSTRSTRTKTKKKETERVEAEPVKRSTRTKTRKMQNDEGEDTSETPKDVEELPKRTTRTKTRAKQAVVEEEEAETRTTRTKTRAKNTKRIRDESTDTETNKIVEKKRSRSDSGSEHQTEADVTTKSVFEDARTSVGESPRAKPADATFVRTPEQAPPPASDATVIIEKPKMVKNGDDDGRGEAAQLAKPITNGDPLLTDDESEEEGGNKAKSNGKIGQVFSPYEKTPVKNKVRAFEKLAHVSSSNIPRCIPKAATPVHPPFAPKFCSTSHVQRIAPSLTDDSSAGQQQQQRSRSALKPSSAEYRERERQRLEREHEAQRKKDAMLAAIVEEKRRRREEKQAKAQQQRELREREKRRLAEAQRDKEEKHRRAVAEREERAARQKEEQERRRAAAKQKAADIAREKEAQDKAASEAAERELRKERDARKLEKIEAMKRQQQKQLPVYMVTKPPPLPTFDCYDSDDPEYGTGRQQRSETWDREHNMKVIQYAMMSAGDRIKNTLFCVQAQSVNLAEIFEDIDPRKLKRTSSAIWRKPPRYTMMPNLEETIFSEDEENDYDEPSP